MLAADIVDAGQLTSGDTLVFGSYNATHSASSTLSVSTLTWHPQATNLLTASEVYNFEVANTHTYFIGATNGGVWVHNECTDIARALRAAGNPGEIFRLSPDIAKFPGAQELGYRGWKYHDVLFDADTNRVWDPMTFQDELPRSLDEWSRQFPYWDSYMFSLSPKN